MLYISTMQGLFEPASEDDIIAEATYIYNRYLCRGTIISSPADAAEYLKIKLAQYEHEVFFTIYLNNQHRIINCDEIFRGTIDVCSVYPREILKAAISCNANAVIFAHNHPSGCTTPSEADKKVTDKLKTILDLVDIHVLDHFICGEDIYSFAEHGLL